MHGEQSDNRIVLQARRKPGDRASGGRVCRGSRLAEVVGARTTLSERPEHHGRGDLFTGSIGGQSVQAEELGGGLGEGEAQPPVALMERIWLRSRHPRCKSRSSTGNCRKVRNRFSNACPNGPAGEVSPLGIPTIDRVCRALLNRLGPIFEPVFDDANYGYRQGRSTSTTQDMEGTGALLIFSDLVDHEKPELVNQRVSDGRVLGPQADAQGGVVADGRRLPTDQGTPQGGIVSPLLSNLGPRSIGKCADAAIDLLDMPLITCRNHGEARAALEEARRILAKLGVTLNTGKTRIVHVDTGSSFSATRQRASGLLRIGAALERAMRFRPWALQRPGLGARLLSVRRSARSDLGALP